MALKRIGFDAPVILQLVSAFRRLKSRPAATLQFRPGIGNLEAFHAPGDWCRGSKAKKDRRLALRTLHLGGNLRADPRLRVFFA